VTYRVNSEPNDVTGKQYRLDVLRYSLFHLGLRVDVILSSPSEPITWTPGTR